MLFNLIQHIVGLFDFFKFCCGFRVVSVLVRVVFQYEPLVGFFDLILSWKRICCAKLQLFQRIEPLHKGRAVFFVLSFKCVF